MLSGRRIAATALATATISALLGVLAPTPSQAAPVGITQVFNRTLPQWTVESSPNVTTIGGQPAIIFGNHDGNLYAVRPDGSDVPGWPRQTGDGIDSSPAAADVNGDGANEIFTGSGTPARHRGRMWSFDENGNTRWSFNGFDGDDASVAFFSSPAIGDTNFDGQADVTGFTLGLHGYNFNANSGAMNPGWHIFQDDSLFSSPALMDVDGDGQTDMVVGGDSAPGAVVDHRGGLVRALRGDGSVIWQYFTDDIVRSSPSVGDVDGDGEPEIVVGVGDYWVRQPGGAQDSTKLLVLDRRGRLKWSRDLGAFTMASPTLADVNGDGRLDIIEGTWEKRDYSIGGKVFAFDGFGNVLPNWNGKDSGGGNVIGQITTADFDNDGGQDLLVPTGGIVTAYSGKTGAKLFDMMGGQAGFQNSPWVGDLDNDSRLDIVIVGGKPNRQGVVARYEVNNTTAKLGSLGWHQFRKDTRHTGSWTNTPFTQSRCLMHPGESYMLGSSDGGLYSFCANFYGSMGGKRLNAPVVGFARRPDNDGYWQVSSDGGIFTFGNARFQGSAGALRLVRPIVGMTPTPSGNGYWLVASDGGIFAYGDARFYGSMGGAPLNSPIVGMTSTPSGNGYWMVASDGGMFAFGDARFYGSMGGSRLNQPIVSMTSTGSGSGYWLVASDGGIFAYGDAQFRGSMGGTKLNQPIVGMTRNSGGNGYRLVARDGGIFAFNSPFLGSMGGARLNAPIIAMG